MKLCQIVTESQTFVWFSLIVQLILKNSRFNDCCNKNPIYEDKFQYSSLLFSFYVFLILSLQFFLIFQVSPIFIWKNIFLPRKLFSGFFRFFIYKNFKKAKIYRQSFQGRLVNIKHLF